MAVSCSPQGVGWGGMALGGGAVRGGPWMGWVGDGGPQGVWQ